MTDPAREFRIDLGLVTLARLMAAIDAATRARQTRDAELTRVVDTLLTPALNALQDDDQWAEIRRRWEDARVYR